ncbi:DAK2 domain-containing protein [Leekyejoonella antrihumi]|nr:DAK2 domain-containing protein [Leekyejoonella antrihumi]
MTLTQLDVVALRRWVVTARADLSTHAASLDRLNVFPVPDGDTGTNLLITMDRALHTLAEEAPTQLGPAAQALAQATLVAARGNSGVILSQLVRGVAQVVSELDRAALDGRDVAAVFQRASDLARRGVGDPVEGTMLTVAAAAAEGARRAAESSGRLVDVVDSAIDAASVALLATREQLEVLREAGVVDAGGAGYLLVIQALQRVVHGGPPMIGEDEPEWLRVSRGARTPQTPGAVGRFGSGAGPGGPAYEVMFLLSDSDDERVEMLQETLRPLGDSLIVAGGPQLWTVHVHVDDVAAALNAGAEAGRPHRFSVTRFVDQMAGTGCVELDEKHVCRLALVDGPGLVEVAQREGAVVPHAAGGGMPTAAECSAEVAASGAASAVLLAGSKHARIIALEAAEILGRSGRRAVVPHCAHPSQVLAALAVLGPEPDGDLDSLGTCVESAVADMRTARVELKQGGGPVPGSGVLGTIGDEEAMAGADVADVATALLDRLLDDGGELVTVVAGEGAPDDLLDRVVAHLRARSQGLEVTAIAGGGHGQALAIGVE